MTLPVMQFCSSSYYFLPLVSKCLYQHLILKQSQSMSFP
jgi:hypothetical protein